MQNSVFKQLEEKIGIQFLDHEILQTVFIHKSYLNEVPRGSIESNERLEFLGDAVLELVVTEFLYKHYPNDEGELTNWRSALVKGTHLAHVAKKLDLGNYLVLSHGEEKSGGRTKNYILANTFEALIGAVYLDHGYEISHKFINKFVLIYLEDILEKGLHIDSKSKLQEIAQERLSCTPIYRLIEENGPDHEKEFKMGVYFGDELIAAGEGSSKQNAEQDAAFKALKAKNWAK
ncbi:MAG: RNAse III, ribonuclease III [Candidatus Peregrinibacteria bacterium GW2011_GWE2_39_6]|nr:MAG: RNAse III, ribonuclease III [Candidatus Peregrinibacteria bacterium GW2011_GWF2_39_17]KKR26701.1 MAG: RNAse III, ribonuclease III [Candidatus Peregrinibacteria bacterium GW2011_GWE2_39_6]HCW32934.1 ribonuclease III [Candidatus Peregrinibacteria bacterium]